jgi:GNAT superfamily N-acetyltransferase
MMCWPMGSSGDLAQRFTRCFAYFLEMALPLGLIWAAGQADGLAVWVAPEHRLTWALHPWDQPQILSLADDGGVRYQTFWDWVAAHEPTEPLWQLDSIAVEPGLQGRGIGKALIEAGLARASADRTGAYLSTGTAENVAIYRHCGFRVYDEADAPDEGPHIWFMRWDP